MKCLRITTRSPSGSGPRNEMHLFGTLPTGAISYVCRVEDHKAEWLYQTKRAALKKVEYISKSEYWEECAPHILGGHYIRAHYEARETETSK